MDSATIDHTPSYAGHAASADEEGWVSPSQFLSMHAKEYYVADMRLNGRIPVEMERTKFKDDPLAFYMANSVAVSFVAEELGLMEHYGLRLGLEPKMLSQGSIVGVAHAYFTSGGKIIETFASAGEALVWIIGIATRDRNLH